MLNTKTVLVPAGAGQDRRVRHGIGHDRVQPRRCTKIR